MYSLTTYPLNTTFHLYIIFPATCGKSSSELSCFSFFQNHLSVKEGLSSNPNVSRAYGCGMHFQKILKNPKIRKNSNLVKPWFFVKIYVLAHFVADEVFIALDEVAYVSLSS